MYIITSSLYTPKHQGFSGGERGGKKFVGDCHSVMHEYETIQIFKLSGRGIIEAGGGGNSRAPHPLAV